MCRGAHVVTQLIPLRPASPEEAGSERPKVPEHISGRQRIRTQILESPEHIGCFPGSWERSECRLSGLGRIKVIWANHHLMPKSPHRLLALLTTFV